MSTAAPLWPGLPQDVGSAELGPSVAVIDVGSNSGRVALIRLEEGAHLATLEDARAPLRLVRGLDAHKTLGKKAVERTVAALRGFRAIVEGTGGTPLIAVATAAVREASNGPELLQRIEADCGVQVSIMDGTREATCGFLGAVHALPASDGMVLDVGGGSLQLVAFRDRTLAQSWSLPLGALRLSDRFLRSDPPEPTEVDQLRAHVQRVLRDSAVPRMPPDHVLVGTGGTIRNLAKMDRRRRSYPVPRLHGYILHQSRVRELATLAAGMDAHARQSLPGLNRDRADSIVGGALAVLTVMEQLQAVALQVSGAGLREGVALTTFLQSPTLPPVATVRRSSLAALARRFRSWDPAAANRRAALAGQLQQALDPAAEEEMVEALAVSAWLLDLGRAIDFYNRHQETARILVAADIEGFTHRQLVLTAATCVLADRDGDLKAFEPVLAPADLPPVRRAAALLQLADAVERLLPPLYPPDAVRCTTTAPDHVELAVPALDTWPLQGPVRRVQHAFAARSRHLELHPTVA